MTDPLDFVCLDSETCGLFGPIVLFQWGEGMDGPIHLYSPMKKPIKETVDLFKWVASKKVLGFNLAFDVFKIQQAITTLMLLGKRVGLSELPIHHVDAYALCEPQARDGPAWKPAGALDLMLHARKGPWQTLMARDPIVVRRVPIGIAPLVLRELEVRINLPDIFFAKKKDKTSTKWKIHRIKRVEGEDPDFVNIVLDFAPSSALKALATHELGLNPMETLVYSDIEVDRRFLPEENGFAPFALSVGVPGRWNGAWPQVIEVHSDHWEHNELAREYAKRDIVYPRALWDKWGRPAFDDNDSLLACLAGSTRWKGFSINRPGIRKLTELARVKMSKAPRAPAAVMAHLKQFLDPVEQVVLKDQRTGNLTTKKVVLEEIRKLKSCPKCLDGTEHQDCVLVEHKAAAAANDVLTSRQGKKEEEIFVKLDLAQRFHASVNVIGARSSRQSGGQVTEMKKAKKSGGLNPQGINKKKNIREQFPLAFTPEIMAEVAKDMQEWIKGIADLRGLNLPIGLHTDEWNELGYPVLPELLVGGDFDKFEVCIADAYYEDPQLRIDLTGVEPPCENGECKFTNYKGGQFVPCCSKCTGKPSKPGSVKIHAIIGSMAYKGRSYWEIRATDGKDRDPVKDKDGNLIPGLKELFPHWPVEHWVDLYTRAKSAFFALIYFGNEDTLANRLGIPKEDGLRVFTLIMARYPVMAAKREEFYESFCPVRQPDNGQVFWVEPDDYGESMNGFKRFVTLENKIIRTLFDLAEDVPPEWKSIKVKVVRRDKVQTIWGAVRSALYGAAHGLQGANQRAIGNHVIQSTGAILTKELQILMWALQPSGVHSWVARILNVHDELMAAISPELEQRTVEIQEAFIQERRSLIRLLAMKWRRLGTWAGK